MLLEVPAHPPKSVKYQKITLQEPNIAETCTKINSSLLNPESSMVKVVISENYPEDDVAAGALNTVQRILGISEFFFPP